MKILQVCPKCPHPAVDGGCIAIDNITRGLLAEGHEVKVLAISTHKHPASGALADRDYVRDTRFETLAVDTRIKPGPALLNLFSTQSYNIQRFYSPRFERLITEILSAEDFDVIHLESLYTAPYLRAIRKVSSAPVIYREHNIEHQIWEGNREATRNQAKRAYLGVLLEQLRRFETRVLNQFDGVAAITRKDAETLRALGCALPIEVIPFGLNMDRFAAVDAPLGPSVFHLGAMDWLPNQEAMRFLIDRVWPELRAKHPKLELHLAGRAMPRWMRKLDVPGVVVAGEVPDARAFMTAHGIMIVPLFSGSGMRIKIIEGLALGRAVVTTPLGAMGIDYTDGHNLAIAEDAPGFVRRIEELITDEAKRQRMGQAARRLVEERYNNHVITQRLAAFYERLTSRRPVAALDTKPPQDACVVNSRD